MSNGIPAENSTLSKHPENSKGGLTNCPGAPELLLLVSWESEERKFYAKPRVSPCLSQNDWEEMGE